MSPYCSAHDEWLIMKLCMYVRYHTANNVSNFGCDPVTQVNLINVLWVCVSGNMSPCFSAHDEWLIMKLCVYVRYHTANNVSNFGGDPVTQLHFITIFNVFFYLRHFKRFRICLPRGRSRSIINIHTIVTSRWWIKRFHRRRASGVRVKRDAGQTSLSKALVNLI